MRLTDNAIAAYAVVCTFGVLYGHQPLLPAIQADMGVGLETASLLTTAAMLSLAAAPLAYGMALGRLGTRAVLGIGLGGLALTEVGLALAPGFGALLGVRLVQGLFIPAVFTALMTHIAASSTPESVHRNMSLYVAATIFGGFFGRLVCGLAGAHSWRAAFWLVAASLVAALLLVPRLAPTPAPRGDRPRLSDVRLLLRRPGFLRVYLAVGCAFFVFAGLLNFLPFRLAEMARAAGADRPSSLRIALMYAGYLMGILASLWSGRTVALMRGERRAMLLGIGLYIAALALFLTPDRVVMFGAMFLVCAGMFTVHSVAPGLLNNHLGDRGNTRGLANGLYLSFYYTGGVLGSSVPGLAYRWAGWSGVVGLLVLVLGAGGAALMGLGGMEEGAD